MDLSHVTARQRAYFRSGATLPLPARRRALEALLRGLADREDALLAALEADLGKPPMEGYMTELGLVREELRFHLKHLARWPAPCASPPRWPTSRPGARSARSPTALCSSCPPGTTRSSCP